MPQRFSLFLAPVLLSLSLFAQAPAPAAVAAPSDTAAARQQELQSALTIDEPGAQLRALEAFVQQYPHADETSDAYQAMIKDATALADSRRVLEYNIKLQQLDPADIGQRITTLNLLLLETDPQSRALAVSYAHDLELAVQAKAHDAPTPNQAEPVSPADYNADMSRLQALAALFQGAAAQGVGRYAEAETYLRHSLQLAQSEEAAEHLATVLIAEDQLSAALDADTLALALPGDTIAGRAALLAQATDLYHRVDPTGAPPSLGDRILAQFREVAARDAAEQKTLSPDPSGRNLHAGSAADFTFLGLDGASHRLGDAFARHQVVVASFWTAASGPPAGLAAIRAGFAAQSDVVFLAIDEDPAPTGAGDPAAARAAAAAAYCRSHPALGAEASVWLDQGLAGYLSLEALPAVLVFDRGGTMVYRRENLLADAVPDAYPNDLAQAITAALSGTAR